MFVDESECEEPVEPDESRSLHYVVTSPHILVPALLLSLAALLVAAHLARTHRRAEEFHSSVRQTLDTDSHTSESDKLEPPPYKTVLRLGRSYQYCDI